MSILFMIENERHVLRSSSYVRKRQSVQNPVQTAFFDRAAVGSNRAAVYSMKAFIDIRVAREACRPLLT